MNAAWRPFRHPVFARIWTATVVSNIGGWMYSAASGWLMTSLTPDPALVALVQAATTLPMFLLALPAGALADTLDKRRFLIFGEAGITVTAALFAAIVSAGLATPMNLLLFTFLSSTAVTLTSPPWQAVVPELVPRQDLNAAIAANSVGMNLSRAIGPALAGVVMVRLGSVAPFWINAVSNLGVIAALVAWHPGRSQHSALPGERLASAMRTGLRYVRNSGPMGATLLRAVAFFFFASAYWALLPLVTRSQIGGGASLYGALLGAIGAAAVGAALVLPRLEQRLGGDALVVIGTLGTACALVLFAVAREWPLALLASVIAGTCWIASVATLNVSAQLALPDWVRGRGLAIFVSAFYGALSIGSIVWGQVAQAAGLPAAHVIAAAGLVVGIPLTRRWRLQTNPDLDLTPSMNWPAPVSTRQIAYDRGPVLVTVEYWIPEAKRERFLAAMDQLEPARRRSGAYGWGIFEDTGRDGRFVEAFLVGSWLEHLRQHERGTTAELRLQNEITASLADGAPVVTHLVAARPGTEGQPDESE